MRAKTWLRPGSALVLGATLAAGCAAPSSAPPGIAEAGDGSYVLATRGPTAAAAVERGLNQASQHCADQNRMIAVQSTRIDANGYNLAFRCLAVPLAPPSTQMAAALPPLPAAGALPPTTAAPFGAEPLPPAAPAFGEPTPAAGQLAPFGTPVAVPSAAPTVRPMTPGGVSMPVASSPLPPIAGGGSGLTARSSPGLPPSSFWQMGR